MTARRIRIGGAPLRGPLRVLAAASTCVFVAVLALTWHDHRAYEAHAVVQIRPVGAGLSFVEARLLGRDLLEATAARHGITETPAVTMAEAVGIHPLRTEAGASLGLAPETIGMIVSVRLPDRVAAVRVANDIALQAIDLGRAGRLDLGRETLDHYRSEENRLRQEIAALRSDPGPDGDTPRRLRLMQAEYDAVAKALAQAEVEARLQDRLQAAPYTLLARAKEAIPMGPPSREIRLGLAALAASFGILSLLLGREIRLPSLPEPSSDSGRSRSS